MMSSIIQLILMGKANIKTFLLNLM